MEPLEHRGQDRAERTGGSCAEKIIRRVGPWKGFRLKEWRGLYFRQGVYLKGKVCTAKKKGNKIYDMCRQLCMLFSYTHFMETEAQRISLLIQGAQEISAWTSTQLQIFLHEWLWFLPLALLHLLKNQAKLDCQDQIYVSQVLEKR